MFVSQITVARPAYCTRWPAYLPTRCDLPTCQGRAWARGQPCLHAAACLPASHGLRLQRLPAKGGGGQPVRLLGKASGKCPPALAMAAAASLKPPAGKL